MCGNGVSRMCSNSILLCLKYLPVQNCAFACLKPSICLNTFFFCCLLMLVWILNPSGYYIIDRRCFTIHSPLIFWQWRAWFQHRVTITKTINQKTKHWRCMSFQRCITKRRFNLKLSDFLNASYMKERAVHMLELAWNTAHVVV